VDFYFKDFGSSLHLKSLDHDMHSKALGFSVSLPPSIQENHWAITHILKQYLKNFCAVAVIKFYVQLTGQSLFDRHILSHCLCMTIPFPFISKTYILKFIMFLICIQEYTRSIRYG